MGNRSNIKSIGNQITGQNLGTGACVFNTKTNNVLEFKTIGATGNTIQIISTPTEILISGQTGGGSGITGATNGLSTDANCRVCLGGILTSDININDAYTGNYGLQLDEIKCFYSNTYNSATNRSAIIDQCPIAGIAMCVYNSSSIPYPQNATFRMCPITGEIEIRTYDDVSTDYSCISVSKTNITLDVVTGGTGTVHVCNLPSKTSETCVIYIDANGKLSTGDAASGGTGSGIGWSNESNGSTVAGCGTIASGTSTCNTFYGVCAGTLLLID